MGELRNCPKCGKVFVMVKRNLCPACVQEEEEKFEEVRVYLKKNPGATVEEIAEEFEVEEKVVLRWLREGRIESTSIQLDLTCQRCGTPIHIGTLCSKCAKTLTAEMISRVHKKTEEPTQKNDNSVKEDEKRKRRMYVLDKFK